MEAPMRRASDTAKSSAFNDPSEKSTGTKIVSKTKSLICFWLACCWTGFVPG